MSRTVQVRDVPEEVYVALRERASREGRSLSDLLRLELAEAARRPSRQDILERITGRRPAPLDEPPATTVRRMRDAAA